MSENQSADSSSMAIIGVALICVLVALYLYFNPGNENSDNLVTLSGLLQRTPNFEAGGENPDYILIQLANDPTRYKIHGCGLNMVDDSRLYKLSAGDSIVLRVDGDDYTNRSGVINTSVTILEIQQPHDTALLTIANINDCNGSSWKKYVALASIAVAAMFVTFIVKKIRSIR
jgi:hypothetical protein